MDPPNAGPPIKWEFKTLDHMKYEAYGDAWRIKGFDYDIVDAYIPDTIDGKLDWIIYELNCCQVQAENIYDYVSIIE